MWGISFIEMLTLFLIQEKLYPKGKCVKTEIHDTFRELQKTWMVSPEQRQSVIS